MNAEVDILSLALVFGGMGYFCSLVIGYMIGRNHYRG